MLRSLCVKGGGKTYHWAEQNCTTGVMPDGHGLAGWAGGLAWSGAGAGLGRALIGGCAAVLCRSTNLSVLIPTENCETKLKPRWDVHLSGDDDQLGVGLR